MTRFALPVLAWFAAQAAVLLAVGTAGAADADITASIDPTDISVGEPARLTITVSGASLPSINLPTLPGLEFTPVGQSRRIESINGVTNSSFSVTYRVIAQQPGTYIIATIAPTVPPITLHVSAAGNAAGSGPALGAAPPGGSPPGGSPSVNAPPGAAAGSANDAAFVRVRLPDRELYVGESAPVDIEVGTRDGVVASLNGVPALSGDAFTLDKLSAQPARRNEVIDGKPFTLFTWHSVVSAVKPGVLSLTMQIPLTVRIPTVRPSGQFPDNSTLGDLFNDPAFQGFFSASTEKDITVSSPPTTFTVRELPTEGRPADFGGAVGKFTIVGELTQYQVTAGDPVTLRMRVSGEGNFDRVESPMLSDVEHWKTYQPTSQFASTDNTSYRGEKIFEQPLVATEAGKQILPALHFSYFDPGTRRYETLHSEPLTVDVAAATAGPAPGADQTGPAVAGAAPPTGWRPDHAPAAGFADSGVPWYFQPRFLALPSMMLLALPVAWMWLRRRERRASGVDVADARPPEAVRLAGDLDRATSSGDVRAFFHTARSGLQRILAARWELAPEAVTLAEVDVRLGADSDVRRLFALADEAIYSGRRFARPELEVCKRIVLHQMQQGSAS